MARIGAGSSHTDGPIKVKMLKTTKASPNGFTVEAFYEGVEYVLSPSLAQALLGAYEIVGETKLEREPEKKEEEKPKKNAGAAPRNKMASPKENK